MSAKKGVDFLRIVSNYMTKGPGFDQCLQKLNIIDGGDGKCKAEFVVDENHLNRSGGLHGGFTATVVDVVTTYALMTYKETPPGVSVDLHVSYLNAAKEGDNLIVEATTIKSGKTLAYLECELKKKDDGRIIAKGTHTKFVGSGTPVTLN